MPYFTVTGNTAGEGVAAAAGGQDQGQGRAEDRQSLLHISFHSTVTDLARFRGLSMSQPRISAT